MNLPDYMQVRRRIEKVDDNELQMFLKALYLLGAMVSEMTGKVYPSESHLHDAYGPIGNDAWDAEVYPQKIPVAFFRVKTAKLKGQTSRTVALPMEYEEWSKGLYAYFKKAGNEVVFPFTRQQAYQKAKSSNPFKGLKYYVEYTTVPHPKDFGIDILRYVRANELKHKYEFNTEDLEAYGICNVSIRRLHRQTAVSLTSEHNAHPWNRYLLKLCK